MQDWGYAQSHPSEQLARVHHFSMTKVDSGRETQMTITVKEFFTPEDPAMPFFATADKPLNQKTIPYIAHGWGKTMLQALSACIREINRFPYQEES